MSTTVPPVHRVLARQLARIGLDPARPPDPAQWARLLDQVSASYTAADQDRYTAERAQELSQREMDALHANIAGERERLAAMLGALPVALVHVGSDLKVRFANPSARALIPGIADTEPVPALLIGAQGAAVRFDELLGRATDEPRGALTTRAGTLEVAWRVEPATRGGVSDGMLVLITDTREHRQREAALETARTAEALSQRTVLARGMLLANVSHELRTPLNAILGYTEMLQEDCEPGQHGDLARIAAAGQHLLALIHDLLDLSRIDAGRMELEIRDVCLTEEIQAVVATAAPLMLRGGNRLVVSIEDLPRVATDPTRLRQCLINLLGNAAKFTTHGEVHLIARVRGAGVEFLVRDTGIGIAPQHLERVFEAFEQVCPTDGQGTGLGLALTRAFVRLLGGSISVESEVGRGSCFRVRMPLAPPATAGS